MPVKLPVKPIRPEEVSDSPAVPDEVISGFNHYIGQMWDGKDAHFREEAVAKYAAKEMDLQIPTIYRLKYLEAAVKLFEEVGWHVVKVETIGVESVIVYIFTKENNVKELREE